MKYRRKPTVVEAEQWFTDAPVSGVCYCASDEVGRAPHVHTTNGVVRVLPADWIITEHTGERYPCKHDLFEATYEAAE